MGGAGQGFVEVPILGQFLQRGLRGLTANRRTKPRFSLVSTPVSPRRGPVELAGLSARFCHPVIAKIGFHAGNFPNRVAEISCKPALSLGCLPIGVEATAALRGWRCCRRRGGNKGVIFLFLSCLVWWMQ